MLKVQWIPKRMRLFKNTEKWAYFPGDRENKMDYFKIKAFLSC